MYNVDAAKLQKLPQIPKIFDFQKNNITNNIKAKITAKHPPKDPSKCLIRKKHEVIDCIQEFLVRLLSFSPHAKTNLRNFATTL